MIAQYQYRGIQHRVFLEGSYMANGQYQMEVRPQGSNQVIRAVASDSKEAERLCAYQLEKIFGRIET